jgi:AcrR family transcriptional regulator
MMETEKVQETKRHILEVASREFFNKGYDAASINTIVDAARVTKPTVYYHFKNKEGLFNALVTEAYHRCYKNRLLSIDEALPIREQIARVVASDFDFCLEQPELVRFVLSLTFDLPGESSGDLTGINYRHYQFFYDLIERGINKGELDCPDVMSAALALQGIIDINIVSFLKMGQDTDFLSNKRASKITDMFLDGINRPC